MSLHNQEPSQQFSRSSSVENEGLGLKSESSWDLWPSFKNECVGKVIGSPREIGCRLGSNLEDTPPVKDDCGNQRFILKAQRRRTLSEASKNSFTSFQSLELEYEQLEELWNSEQENNAWLVSGTSSGKLLGDSDQGELPSKVWSIKPRLRQAAPVRSMRKTPSDIPRAYPAEKRRQCIERYVEKRAKRVWRISVRYDCRKEFAVKRPRIGGRFLPKGLSPPNSCATSPPTTAEPCIGPVETIPVLEKVCNDVLE